MGEVDLTFLARLYRQRDELMDKKRDLLSEIILNCDPSVLDALYTAMVPVLQQVIDANQKENQ